MKTTWYQHICTPVNYCQYIVHSLKHNDVPGPLINGSIILKTQKQPHKPMLTGFYNKLYISFLLLYNHIL
ncbi:hypothetical protein A6J61_12185 [Staphylococcus lugdunensis]|nr:hypothetical protein A6J61_12185 [Staphylococcus lugdunensis]